MFEAPMCFFTIYTKYNEPLASVNCDSDDDRYDIVGYGAAGQHSNVAALGIFEAVALL